MSQRPQPANAGDFDMRQCNADSFGLRARGNAPPPNAQIGEGDLKTPKPSERQYLVQEQTTIRTALLKNGYVPLANKDKMCTLKGWSKLEVDAELIATWSGHGYRATGVRLDGQLVMVDFDIDDTAMIEDIIDHAIDTARDPATRARLELLRDEAPVRFGKGQKEAWFCRVKVGEEGFIRYASTAHCLPGQDPDGEGVVLQRLEVFNGSGRQAGVYGAHTLEGGEIVRSYSWLDDVGLAETPLADLVELTREDIAHLCDCASAVMSSRGWPRHLHSKHGQTAELKVFDLDADKALVFETVDGDVDLAGLERLVQARGSVRLSASWLEGRAAQNKSRCIADLHPIDGGLAILDTATWQTHRPADMDRGNRMARLAAALADTGFIAAAEAAEARISAEGGEAFFSQTEIDDILYDAEDKPKVTVYGGYTNEAATASARLMAGDERFFDYGGEPAVVTGCAVELMCEARLAHELANAYDYYKPGKPAGADEPPNDPIKIDPPAAMVKQVMALGKARGLRPLRGVVDVPVIRLDGEVVGQSGYDAASHLFVRLGADAEAAAAAIPALPSRDDMAHALEVLWAPFREFPFVDAEARGGMLAALLTAAIRTVLPTAPAFAFDAPAQGSGKTLLARCVGALAGTSRLLAPLPTRDEAEVAKVLLSVLIEPPRAAIFDNQLGLVDSASLASILTSEVYSGRILGSTRTVEAPTNMVVMLTGNNIALGGDMPRRVVTVRIDAKSETPFSRVFDFDPLAVVRARRVEMICAALTLIRGAFAVVGQGRIGSFEDWDRLVAQTVEIVGRSGGVGRGEFADPTALLIRAHETDPTRGVLHDILDVLRAQFGSRWFSAKEIWDVVSGTGPGHKELVDAFEGISHGKLTKRGIGMMLQNRNGQRIGGQTLEVLADARNGNKYRVVDDADVGGVVVEGRFDKAMDAALGAVGHLKG